MMIKLHSQGCSVKSNLFKYILVCCLSTVCTSVSFAQIDILTRHIHLDRKVTTAKNCVESIYAQHDIVIAYSSSFFDEDKEVSLSHTNPTIREILDAIIESQPLAYEIKNKYKIILVYNEENLEELAKIKVAPAKILVSGYVRDADSGEPLIGSYVYNKALNRTVTTDVNGYFQLNLLPTEDSLFVSYIGYGENQVDVQDLYTKRVENILLAPSLLIEEIVIESVVSRKLESIKTHNYFINYQDLNEGVSSFGEHDPYRSLKLLPSIQSGREAENNIYVRGGGPEQNLILMDGVPMYETSHILGLSSIFNVDAIKNIQVYKDAFPAKFGGRLSSVIDFQMKEGNVYEHKRSINFSPSSIRFHVEGPIKKGVSGYNVSVRSSFLDLFYSDRLKEVLDYTETEISFLDFNAKVNHQFEDGSKLKVNAYFGTDIVLLQKDESLGDLSTTFDISNSDRITWGNRILGFHYNKAFSEKLNTNVSVNLSSYTADTRSSYAFDTYSVSDTSIVIDTSEIASDVITQSNVSDAAIKADFDYFVSNETKLNFGAGYAFHSLTPTIKQSNRIEKGSVKQIIGDNKFEATEANEYYVYLEGKFELPREFTLNVGGRFNIYEVRKKIYPSLQPRLSIAKDFGEDHHFVFSVNRMTQFVHLLVNNGIGLPSRLWLPSTDILPPEFTNQLSFSYQYFLSNEVTFELGGYLKKLYNVVEYSSNSDLFSSFVNNDDITVRFDSDETNWEDFIEIGNSDSKGLEVSIKKHSGKMQWNIAYSLNKTTRTFENLNNGEPFPYRYDRRHDLSMYLKYNLSPNFNIFTTWIFGTGDAFSLATEEFPGPNGSVLLVPAERNNFRFAYYKKFDIGLQYTRDLPGPGQKMRIDFGIQNVFNRKNAYYYYILRNPATESFEVKQVSVFPLLPQFNIYLTL